MIRTPLLESLARAAAAARSADTVRAGEHATPALSRRHFLGAAAAGIGLAACDRVDRLVAPGSPRRASGKGGSAPRVAIVGAGLAGLTAAYRLSQAGIRATVYEARGRLGGRCFTARGAFAAGQIAEHGGELIDQSHTQLRQLAQELGLTLDNVVRAQANGTDPIYWFDGAPYTFADATRDLKPVWQALHRDYNDAGYPTLYNSFTARGAELDAMSVAAWIDSRVPGGRVSRLGQLLEVAYVIEYGADAEEQSALNLIYLLGVVGQGQFRVFGPSNEKYHVRGGNDLVVQGLAAALGGQIATQTPLAGIRRTTGGAYTLSFQGAADVTADHVILALPFSILRTLDYGMAGFDDVKRLAIAQLGMGANAKLNVQFDRRHWASLGYSGDTFADAGYQATWDVTRAQPGTPGILVDYTGGSIARAQSGKSLGTLVAQFLGQIEPLMPGLTARYNGRATFDDWASDPWVRGAYSYWRVGQYTRFAGAEGARSGNCHFAGEHTSIDAQGYLEGAVESGERAASEILADVKAA